VPDKPVADTDRITGRVLVYTTQNDDDRLVTAGATSFTGGGMKLTTPIGMMSREIALKVFSKGCVRWRRCEPRPEQRRTLHDHSSAPGPRFHARFPATEEPRFCDNARGTGHDAHDSARFDGEGPHREGLRFRCRFGKTYAQSI
jgi:hypothetical protein